MNEAQPFGNPGRTTDFAPAIRSWSSNRPRYPVVLAACLACVFLVYFRPAASQGTGFDLVQLDKPIGLSNRQSDRENETALRELKAIDEALPKFRETLTEARRSYEEADAWVASRREWLDDRMRLAEIQLGGKPTLKEVFAKSSVRDARADLDAAEANAKAALLGWSAQYSRYHRLRTRRVMVLLEIYSYRPAHVTHVSGRGGGYCWIEDPALEKWFEKVRQALNAVAVFQDNIRTLQQNQQSIAEEFRALDQDIRNLQIDYRNRLESDLATRTLADIAASLSNLAGGGVGLGIEAGYQSIEWATYAFGDGFGGEGWLKDYSFDHPTLSDELLDRVKHAGETTAAAEYAEALSRYARIPAGGGPGQIDGAARSGGMAAPVSADSRSAFPWLDYLYGQGQGAVINVFQDEDIYFAAEGAAWKALNSLTSGDMETAVPTMLEDLRVPDRMRDLLPQDRLPTLRRQLAERVTWIEKGKGLAIAVAASALADLYKEAYAGVGRSRAVIVAESAVKEVEWLAKRRQLVAHRLLTERYLYGALLEQERIFKAIANPPAVVRDARRYRDRLEPPTYVVGDDKIRINVEFDQDLAGECTAFLYPLGLSVLAPGTKPIWEPVSDQDRRIYELAFANPAGAEMQSAGIQPLRLGGDDVEFDGSGLADSPGFGIFVYPSNDFGATELGADTFHYMIDLDSSTPVTHFEEWSLSWAGQEKSLTPNSLYRFLLGKPVQLKLRNGEQRILVRPE